MGGIRVQITGKDSVLDAMRSLGADVGDFLTIAMEEQMQRVADHARTSKFGGDPLHRRSGRLSQNISGDASREGSKVTGRIGVDLNAVPYGWVHEYGGTYDIPEHTRRTGYNASMGRIRLLNRAGDVRAAVRAMSRGIVRAHTATYPQRAFLHPSMEEMKQDVMNRLRAGVVRWIRET